MITLYKNDCLKQMAGMDENSIDAIVTDPPYGLKFMGKEWDHGLPGVPFWTEALRISKPGAHLLAFGGTRTFHRLTCAIEDAGWEIRDCLGWIYGSGFPKSLDVSKAIDKAAGSERKRLLRNPNSRENCDKSNTLYESGTVGKTDYITSPATEAARQWDGWGTALKPAWEPIILARKPLEGTVAQNVQKWGTGAINIDGCRVPCDSKTKFPVGDYGDRGLYGAPGERTDDPKKSARWPANLIHDGSEEVLWLFPQTSPAKPHDGDGLPLDTRGQGWGFKRMPCALSDNGGSAARFFYCAKASRAEREAGLDDSTKSMRNDGRKTEIDNPYQRGKILRNHHPTVKPLALMRYLCRLIAPPGGTVLDPFMGSGTTGMAAKAEGFSFIGIEKEKEYCEIAEKRINGQKVLSR